MNASTTLENVLAVISKTLLWCIIMGGALLLFWLVVFLAMGDFGYQVHGRMFDLSRDGFNMMNYCGMACFKLCVFLFFVIPFLAIQLVRRGMRRSATAGV